MHTDPLPHVRSRFKELGVSVSTFMQEVQMEGLARFLRQDEKIIAALAALSVTYVKSRVDRCNGFIVLTDQHIVFYGIEIDTGRTAFRLPLEDVSRVVPFEHSNGGIRVYYTTSTTNQSFRVIEAGTFEAVNNFASEFKRLTGRSQSNSANSMHRDRPNYVRSRLEELGVDTILRGKETELLARFLRQDEKINAAFYGTYGERVDDLFNGFIVLTEQHIVFAGRYRKKNHTFRLTLEDVSRVFPFRFGAGGIRVYYTTSTTNRSFRVIGAGTFEAVTDFANEFARLTGKPTTDPAKEVPRTNPSPEASRTTQTVERVRDPDTATNTASSSSRKSQPGGGKLSGCLGVVVVLVVIVVIVGLISDACSGDDSGNDSALSPVQQGALRDAQTYGLDAIAAANGISDARLADLILREAAFVLRALEQFAGNRQRYDIVWGSCYNSDVHPHRPRSLQSGLATYCGDFVDSLR